MVDVGGERVEGAGAAARAQRRRNVGRREELVAPAPHDGVALVRRRVAVVVEARAPEAVEERRAAVIRARCVRAVVRLGGVAAAVGVGRVVVHWFRVRRRRLLDHLGLAQVAVRQPEPAVRLDVGNVLVHRQAAVGRPAGAGEEQEDVGRADCGAGAAARLVELLLELLELLRRRLRGRSAHFLSAARSRFRCAISKPRRPSRLVNGSINRTAGASRDVRPPTPTRVAEVAHRPPPVLVPTVSRRPSRPAPAAWPGGDSAKPSRRAPDSRDQVARFQPRWLGTLQVRAAVLFAFGRHRPAESRKAVNGSRPRGGPRVGPKGRGGLLSPYRRAAAERRAVELGRQLFIVCL